MGFNNRAFLKQSRDGIKKHIDESPSIITVWRKAMKDDGFGGTVEDPFSDPSDDTFKARLSHEQKGPELSNEVPPGLSTNLSRFILVDYETTIYEGDYFKDAILNKSYRIGPVDPLVKFGGIIGYQAPLLEAEQNEDT